MFVVHWSICCCSKEKPHFQATKQRVLKNLKNITELNNFKRPKCRDSRTACFGVWFWNLRRGITFVFISFIDIFQEKYNHVVVYYFGGPLKDYFIDHERHSTSLKLLLFLLLGMNKSLKNHFTYQKRVSNPQLAKEKLLQFMWRPMTKNFSFVTSQIRF